MPGAQRHPELDFDGDLLWRKTLHFWIHCENPCIPKNYQKFLTSFEPPKGSKTPPKCPLCHFLATQEAMLGELIFGGKNGHQIPKFHFSQKVYRKSFPTGPFGANLVKGRPPKSTGKKHYAQEKWRYAQDGKVPFCPKNSVFSPSFFSV